MADLRYEVSSLQHLVETVNEKVMPPLKTARASKACDRCRKFKTRCYASDKEDGTCLRCDTLAQPCSLQFNLRSPPEGSRRLTQHSILLDDVRRTRSEDGDVQGGLLNVNAR